MATFDFDVAVEPNYLDFIDIAAGYGVLSVPVDGFFQGDYVQTATLTITPRSGGAPVVTKAVDMVQRTDGFFEFLTQESISAHFSLSADDVAAIGATPCVYSASVYVMRTGITDVREVQSGSIAARSPSVVPPLLASELTISGGPVTGQPTETAQLTATVYDGFGNVIPLTVAWSSTNPAIAQVDAGGLVTFLTPGVVTISATVQGLSDSTTATTNATFAPVEGDVLIYLSGLFQPTAPTAARIQPGTFSGSGSSLYAFPGPVGLGGIDYTFPASQTAGFYLTTDGSGVLSWANPVAGLTLNSLADVTISGASTGQFLQKSAGDWVNHTLVSADISDATASNTPSRVVLRDGSGAFAAGAISATGITVSGSSALQALTATSGLFSSGIVVSAGGIGVIGASAIVGSLSGITTLSADTADFTTLIATAFNVTTITATTVNATNLGGTLTTAAQPNVTSTGVLAGLHMTSAVVNSGGLSITLGGLAVAAGGLTVAAGATSVQALAATDGVFSGTLSAVGVTSSSGLTVTGATVIETLNATTGDFSGAVHAASLVVSGATSLQAVTSTTISATTGTFSGAVSAVGLSSSSGLTVSVGATSVQAFSGTTGAFSSTLAVAGNFAVATTKFVVVASSGDTSIVGSLDVNGVTTVTSLNATTGDFTGSVSAVGLLSSSGLTVASGTTAVQALTATTGAFSSNLAVNTDKFTVQASTGNTLVAGTLTVTGALGGSTGVFSGSVTASSFVGALGHTLTFGTHLTGGSFTNAADVTLGTDATAANTVSTLVSRDSAGSFAATAVTLSGLLLADDVHLGAKTLGWFPTIAGETNVVDNRYAVGNAFRYGAVGDGVADDTVALQAMLDNCIFNNSTTGKPAAYLPVGKYKISAKLRLKNVRLMLTGAGQYNSIILYSGVAAGALVMDALAYGNYNFSDFSIVGDASSGAALDFSAVSQHVYNSTFERMQFFAGQQAILAPSIFSAKFDSLYGESINNHIFQVASRTAITWIDCWGQHAPANKAAFRLAGTIRMYGCNGVGSVTGYWGVFGSDLAGTDGFQGDFSTTDYPDVILEGCNFEDWGTTALYAANSYVQFRVNGGTFNRALAGTYPAAIRSVYQAFAGNGAIILEGCRSFLSGGAPTIDFVVQDATNPSLVLINDSTGFNTITKLSGGTQAYPAAVAGWSRDATKIIHQFSRTQFTEAVTFSTAASKIVPGATSLSIRDSGDGRDNLLVSEAGAVTAHTSISAPTVYTTGTFQISGSPAGPGGATRYIGAGSSADSWVFNVPTGALDYFAFNDVIKYQISATGIFPFTDNTVRLGSTGGRWSQVDTYFLTASAVYVNAAAAGKIIGGATSLSLRNAADNADNILVLDNGNITVRGTISGATTISATTFSGALSGNATTATALQNGRTIAMTGDVTWTSPTFDGSGNVTAAGTLATVNANVGTFGDASTIPVVTVNGKGLVTAVTTSAVVAPAGTLSGATLNATVTASSLTSVGTLTAITTSGALTMTATASKVVPGATSLSLRNHADSADNLLIADNGDVTVRGALSAVRTTISGVFIMTGSPGSPGASTRYIGTGASTDSWVFNVPTGGIDYFAFNDVVKYTFSASGIFPGTDNNVRLGNGGARWSQIDTYLLTASAVYVNAAAAGKIIGGATSLSLRNAADNADNVLVVDAGDVTVRGSLTTGAPSGGTAGAWKTGIRVAATVALDTTQYIQLDVGGTLYKVAVVL